MIVAVDSGVDTTTTTAVTVIPTTPGQDACQSNNCAEKSHNGKCDVSVSLVRVSIASLPSSPQPVSFLRLLLSIM